MKPASIGTAVLAALLALPALAQDAPARKSGGILVDTKGMTVYTFDKDSAGKSACTGRCAENWPPVPAPDGNLSAPYSAVIRADGTRQLAYNGKPLYTFVKDRKPGDRTGDKVNDVWHVVAVK